MELNRSQFHNFKLALDPKNEAGLLGKILSYPHIKRMGLKFICLERALILNDYEFRGFLDKLYAHLNRRGDRLSDQNPFFKALLDLQALIQGGPLRLHIENIEGHRHNQSWHVLALCSAGQQFFEDALPVAQEHVLTELTLQETRITLMSLMSEQPDYLSALQEWLTLEPELRPNTQWRKLSKKISHVVCDRPDDYLEEYQAHSLQEHTFYQGDYSICLLSQAQVRETPYLFDERAIPRLAKARALLQQELSHLPLLARTLKPYFVPGKHLRLHFHLPQSGELYLYHAAKNPRHLPQLVQKIQLERQRDVLIEVPKQYDNALHLTARLARLNQQANEFNYSLSIAPPDPWRQALPSVLIIEQSYELKFFSKRSGRLSLAHNGITRSLCDFANLESVDFSLTLNDVGSVDICVLLDKEPHPFVITRQVVAPKLSHLSQTEQAQLHLVRLSRGLNGGVKFNEGTHNVHTQAVSLSVFKSIGRLARLYPEALIPKQQNLILETIRNYLLKEHQTVKDKLQEVQEQGLDPSSQTALKSKFLELEESRFMGLNSIKTRKTLAEIAATGLENIIKYGYRYGLSGTYGIGYVEKYRLEPIEQFVGICCLVWQALNDKTNGAHDRLTAEDLRLRRALFINHLYQVQRGFNINDQGIDNLAYADRLICAQGARNKLIDSLDKIHPAVDIVHEPLQVAISLVREQAAAAFHRLDYAQQLMITSINRSEQDDEEELALTFYQQLASHLKTVLSERFGGILESSQQQEILDQLEYVPLPEPYQVRPPANLSA